MIRKILIVTILILITLGGIGWYLFSSRTTPGDSGDTTSRGGLGSLFPFLGGGNREPQTPGETPETPTEGEPETSPEAPLRQVSNRAVAGFYIYTKENATSPTARILERGTGNIYDIELDGINERHISDTNILRAAEAIFGENGESILIRYVKNDNKTVATYLAKLQTKEEGVGTLTGSFLPDNIVSVAVSPDKKTFYYVTPSTTGSVGYSVRADGGGTRQLFTSPFSEWLIAASAKDTLVTTKASNGIDGYMYRITGGLFERILGNIDGLTTLTSPSGTYTLFNQSSGTNLQLNLHDKKTNAVTALNIATLPEKCVFKKDETDIYCAGSRSLLGSALYPDDWYQGVSHFNDSLWKITVSDGLITELAVTPNLDATHITVSDDENYIFFLNKKDSRLWVFDTTKDL